MKRVTISLEDDMVAVLAQEVADGRAPSVSAWVAEAIRRRVQAGADLDAWLATAEAANPYTTADLEWVADVVGQSSEWVAERVRAGD